MPDEEVEASTSGGIADIVSECNDEEMHISTIRRKIEKMYKKHNPSKLADLDGLLVKYKGREDQLLKAIKQKYRDTSSSTPKPWQFVLKNYDGKRETFKRQQQSLNGFRKIPTSAENVQKLLISLVIGNLL